MSGSDYNLMMYGVAAVAAYVFSSAALFRFPHVLHRKKKSAIYPHISHRGGAGEYLENTMSAFDNAVSVDTDMLEIDVQLTKDGEVVICHDQCLLNLTGQNCNVIDVDYKDLPKLKSSLSVHFDPDKICSGSDQSLVRLVDLLDKYPNIPLNIDIKTDNDELITKTNQLIKKYKRESITVWGNHSSKICNKCYKENPSIPLLISAERAAVITFLFYTGLLPFTPLKESYLETFLPSSARRARRNFSENSKMLDFVIWFADNLMLKPSLIRHLKLRGIPTYIWVCNNKEEFTEAFELGASGVMTDYPTLLRNYLTEHPQFDTKDK